MTRQLTPAQLKNPTIVKGLKERKNIITINGQRYNKKVATPQYYIELGTSRLSAKGLTTRTPAETSLENSAINVLRTLGCSIISQDVDYSLISHQTDTETIENANIFDENTYKKLKNKNVKATDKFVNVDDPFYKLDNPLPHKNTIENTALQTRISKTNVKKCTAALMKMNIENSYASTLKQFK